MLGIPFALMASVGWGISAILVRLGLRNMSVVRGTLISLVTSLMFTAAVTLIIDAAAFSRLSPAIVAWFALAGIINFALGRQFNYQAINRIGAARASPVFSTSPLFAIALAIILLGETINVMVALGALSVLVGLWLVTTSR
ncbi:MAG: DMT family transporter [Chloroflexi bacterium]|nr:DMT family transporter [Chloroflexota bacterium]